jgi:hypothetical protein
MTQERRRHWRAGDQLIDADAVSGSALSDQPLGTNASA